ncbi:EAL domain-containing protein [Maricaulis sp.]|jgi:EAL domain-containing protein (putative c-di-GMP-specific phosphodiesterase class I)|uniref:EAL domain-containing protein n=1 Tax=Maricaulis sp. TaxID=1486257 RepID=UPI002621CCBF|nr:EAL domain-containing protein [Maricaulis sp.]
MTGSDYETGARAAGAVAFVYDAAADRLRFTGDTSRFGISENELDWAGFLGRLGPADQSRLHAALTGARLDLRVRLIGDDNKLAYVRMLGARVSDNRIEGLMTPAGSTADGVGRISEEHALANGVESGEVLAWYQPIIALPTGRLAGFEALARWERPGLGVLSPDDFLDMADDLDLLGRISTQVRALAAADLSSWRTAHEAASALFVAANATVSELVDPGFCDALIARIEEAELPAGAFKLEIAETEIMRDPDRAASAMDRLAAAGIALALDDFGTGYSSLARLDMLPFDVVKIDRYFVRAMAGNESAGTVVKSVIQLASHFGMKVVAEGVESEEAARTLRDMGCHFAQGYRYAGALSPDAAEEAILSGIEGRFDPPAR